MKKCGRCKYYKDFDEFYRCKSEEVLFLGTCKECDRNRRLVKNLTQEQLNKKRSREQVKNLTQEQLDRKRERQRKTKKKEFDAKSPEEKEIFNAKRRTINLTDAQLKRRRENIRNSAKKSKEKNKNNINRRLKNTISTTIYNFLKRNNSSKKGKSISKYLPYPLEDLKKHLENLFEPWMNWSNYGKYDPKIWNDNNPYTWTWQIDHIMPHSKLPYTSMEHENFKKCWSLENLRPYSAKQNILDGNRR